MIIFICCLIIISFLYNLISRHLFIPSVLLLLLTGVLFKYISPIYPAFAFEITIKFLKSLGTLGLVLIVLEGALEIKFNRSTKSMVMKSLLISMTIIFFTSVAIAFLISLYYDTKFYPSLINALPFSIISSAIIIPSAKHLSPFKRDFLTYESIFSDIIGILLFNLLITETSLPLTFLHFSISLIITIIFSLLLSIVLFRILYSEKGNNEIIFSLAILILFYSMGKSANLPTLLIVFFLGIIFNNFSLLYSIFYKKTYVVNFSAFLPSFKSITQEICFFIRTLFFFAFGYFLDIKSLLNLKTLILCLIPLILIIGIRYFTLRLLSKENLSEVLLAPRGLVSILLFNNIPDKFLIHHYEISFLFYIIIITCLIMAGDLMFRARKT